MKKYMLLLFVISSTFIAHSNNLVIANATLTGKNTTDNYVLIQFDISWENSWRTSSGPSNWDAAWVFVKFRIKGQSNWRHASLNWVDGTGTGDGHTVPAGAIIKGASDLNSNSLGVFIYSNADKVQSNASYPGVQLRWQYGDDGIQDSDLLEICVFGIEMVYVPQGEFEIGNIGFAYNSFYSFTDGDPSPYRITSESFLTVDDANGKLHYNSAGSTLFSIPTAFPKGYNAFYCMKYEITQEQYVEFLLKLTSPQASARGYNSLGNRNLITGSYGTFRTDNPYVACNYLSWADLAAYLDWSALRPMTEIEYEKACRGPLPSVQFEFAWGNALMAGEPYTLINAGGQAESIGSNYNMELGNMNYAITESTNDGPLRVGIFATNNSGRITSGATYYGIMEMTGNVYEQAVTVGNATGRLFAGTHGDGLIDANGNHNASSWPATDVGTGLRGGAWTSSTGSPGFHLPVSSRTVAVTGAASRANNVGGRGVRTAP